MVWTYTRNANHWTTGIVSIDGGCPDFELPKLRQIWVSRPSRNVAKSRAGLPTVNCPGSKGSNKPVRTYRQHRTRPCTKRKDGAPTVLGGKKNGA